MSEEAKLVRLCKRRSRKAFDALYKRYASVLFGICLRYAKDTPEAEDMLQESFVTVFLKIDSFKETGSFEGWLKRICVNTSINFLRQRNRLAVSEKNVAEYYALSDDAPSIIQKLSEEEIMTCIQTLPDGYRTVFNLYVIEGYKHKEIAEVLKISKNTSRTQLIKARRALQIEIKKRFNIE